MKTTHKLNGVWLLALCSGIGAAQSSLWVNFDTSLTDPWPKPISAMSAARQDALEAFTLRTGADPNCQDEQKGWEKSLRFQEIRVGGPRVILVTGSCDQADSLNWLVAWNGNRPISLVPSSELHCWFHRVQRPVSHGLHDFTMGCHQSAFATDYAWYRFDGRMYHRIGTACAYQQWMWNSLNFGDLRKKKWDANMGCVPIPYAKNDRDGL
jgi:hypothetical protein